MQIALSIVLFITLFVTLYYQRKSFKLEDELNLLYAEMKKKELKNRTEIDMIRPIAEDYHKNIATANAYVYMRKISDIVIKKETSSTVENES